MMVGGTGEVRDVDDGVKEICEKIKEELETKVGNKFPEFVPLVYRSQLVNGTNYFVKIKVDGDSHVHVRIFKTFQGDVSLHSYQIDKRLDDELVYFQ